MVLLWCGLTHFMCTRITRNRTATATEIYEANAARKKTQSQAHYYCCCYIAWPSLQQYCCCCCCYFTSQSRLLFLVLFFSQCVFCSFSLVVTPAATAITSAYYTHTQTHTIAANDVCMCMCVCVFTLDSHLHWQQKLPAIRRR